jgi:hypothetical protein
LGYSLRERACLTGAPECAGCPVRATCDFAYLFDTPPPNDASKMRRYTQVPHPFVLRETVSPEIPGAADLALELSLFGRGNARLPLLVESLRHAASSPSGIGGRRLEFVALEQDSQLGSERWVPLSEATLSMALAPLHWPDAPAAGLRIHLLSPLRIKRDGRPVRPAAFRFADLFGNLLRRISMLTCFHTDTPLETDFRALMDAAHAVQTDASLRWFDLNRHSARQHAAMSMGGVVGTVDIAASQALAAFWPYLWLGQFTHVGSAATMGLGHYRLASLPQAVPPADSA